MLELLVVLTILIALGGIVVATLPGVLQRTEVATAAANVPQIDASIRQSALLRQGRIGNRFDSLIVGSASLDGEVASYVGGAQQFSTANLTGVEVRALERLGVVELVPAATAPDNATFSSHLQPPVKLSENAKVCVLGGGELAQSLARSWNIDPSEDSKFMVVGVGSQSTLVGAGAESMFPEAPVHFSDNHLANPQAMYSRYLLVFELTLKSDKLAEARYVGTGIPSPEGLRTIGQELEEHYRSPQ